MSESFILEIASNLKLKINDNVSASPNQTQGDGPLDYGVNMVRTVPVISSSVTLPKAEKGSVVFVYNGSYDSSKSLLIWPAVDDTIYENYQPNEPSSLAPLKGFLFFAVDDTTWVLAAPREV